MNERIKELSIKAGFPKWSNHAIEFELEQFAELIVRECAAAYHTTRSIDTPIEQHFRNHLGIE